MFLDERQGKALRTSSSPAGAAGSINVRAECVKWTGLLSAFHFSVEQPNPTAHPPPPQFKTVPLSCRTLQDTSHCWCKVTFAGVVYSAIQDEGEVPCSVDQG